MTVWWSNRAAAKRKSTVTAGIAGALGDYYLLVADRVLLANPSDHPTELMDLRGIRLGVIEETPEARRLNVQRLKKTVGTPQITARRVHKDGVTFNATHSLFLSTNFTPIVEETDHGTWRRLTLVKFPYTYRKTKEECVGDTDRLGDPTLRERVQQNAAGQHEAALAWLVQGAVKWYAKGRIMPARPKRVARDTHAWRVESDLVLAYVDDRLEFDPDSHVMAADLPADVNTWLQAHGHQKWSDKLLASRLGGHDELAGRIKRGRKYRDGDDTDGRSRPKHTSVFEPALPPVPERYRAWLGVRFQTVKDSDSASQSGDAKANGTGGTGDSETPQTARDRGTFTSPVPPVPQPSMNGCKCSCHRGEFSHGRYSCPCS